MHVDKVHNLSQSELNQKYWYLVVTLQSKIGGASIDSILLPKPPFSDGVYNLTVPLPLFLCSIFDLTKKAGTIVFKERSMQKTHTVLNLKQPTASSKDNQHLSLSNR